MLQTATARAYLIGSQLIMLTIRRWLTSQLFPHTKITRQRSLLVWWIIAAILLLAYPYLIQRIFPQHATDYLYTSLTTPFGRERIALFGVYLLLPVLVLILTFRNHEHRILIISSYMICCGLFLVAQQVNSISMGRLVFGYLLIVATSEEFLKLLNTTHIFDATSPLMLNDLLPLSLLSAYGFARFENIIYLAGHIAPGIFSESFLSLLIWRGIFGFLLHGIFSWTVAYMLQKHLKISLSKGLSLWLLLGIALHFIYNTLLTFNIGRWIIIYMLLAYAGTTYFLYHSHRLYIPNSIK